MSETTEQAGGTPAPAEEYRPSHVLSSEPDAPAEAQEATQSAERESESAEREQHQETEAERHERERHEYNRRLGQVTKQKYLERERANQAERERAELARRLAQYEQGQANGQTQNGVPPDWMQHPDVRAAIRAQAAEDARIESFHRAAYAEFPDWDKRRKDLQEMGADGGIAQLLVEMPQGHRVAAALYDEPAELGRIADLQTERARAIALGEFAARIEARRTQAASPSPPRRASNLSAPIQPPSTARSRGEPNPNGSWDEYERWSKQQNWRNR